MTHRQHQIVQTARSLVGTRWRHQGRTREHGLDCAGLIVRVAQDLRLSAFDTTAYHHRPDGVALRQLLDREMVPLPWEGVTYGDVVLLADFTWPCHLGIVADGAEPFSLIHAWAPAKKVVEMRFSAEWRAQVRGAYRYPGGEGIVKSAEVNSEEANN